MATFGQRVVERTGSRYAVSASHEGEKIAGVTIAWTTVIAPSVDAVILPSYGSVVGTSFSDYNQGIDSYVYAGEKYLRLGTVLCKIVGGTLAGKFAPYGSVTNLGGGTLSKAKGDMFILNRTVFEKASGSDHGPVIQEGDVFKARLVQNGTGAADTLAGPTLAEFNTAFPAILFVEV
jgi:hypothetical protein